MISLTFKHALKLLKPFVFLAVLFSPLILNAADIKVKIDRSNIQLNDTFTLTFEANDDVDGDPDFTPLKKNFQVLGQSSSSSIRLINGDYTKVLRWNVPLMALKEGKVTIPSINFGSDKSPEYQITINPIQRSGSSTDEEFMSELDISSSSAYPQSQLIVTQRMLSSRNINGYEFSALKFSGVDAVLEPLGEVKQYQTKRGDTPYLVLEQSFAIYPQSAGNLQIEPSIASARIAINNRSFRSNTKTVRRVSDKKSITVKPIPSSFKGKHWLPANEVQLVEEFPQAGTFTVGEPITRTLSLLADGQSASQLPEFTNKEISNLKQYPDKPSLFDNKTDDGIISKQEIKVAIIPSQAGSYTLPEISIPWWNTTTHKQEIARIPARTFTVGKALSPATQIITEQSPVEAPKTPIINTETTEIEQPEASTESHSLTWQIISLLLAIGWISTLFILWNTKRNISLSSVKPTQTNLSIKQSLKKIQDACSDSDAHSCKDALLVWANLIFTDKAVYSLGELSTHVTSPLSIKIDELNSILYKNTLETWACENLYSLCEEFSTSYKNSNQGESNTEQLKDLYQ